MNPATKFLIVYSLIAIPFYIITCIFFGWRENKIMARMRAKNEAFESKYPHMFNVDKNGNKVLKSEYCEF